MVQLDQHLRHYDLYCRHTPAYTEKKRQSYVVLIAFEWNGLKVSEVNNLRNRKFLEAIASHPNL